jgi:hypothetical protein
MNQIAIPIFTVCQVSRNLFHPISIRLSNDPGDIHLTTRESNREKHMVADQSSLRPHFHRKEICSSLEIPVRSQDFAPWSFSCPFLELAPILTVIASRLWFLDLSHVQDWPKLLATSCNPIPDSPRPSSPRDSEVCLWTVGAPLPFSSLPARIIFLRDQLAMPSEQCLGRHHSRDLLQSPFANSSGLACQSTSLFVGESHSLSATLLLQNSDLLLQVVDHVLSLLVLPA